MHHQNLVFNMRSISVQFPTDVWRFAVGVDAEKKNLDEACSDPNNDFRVEVKDVMTSDAAIEEVMEELRTMMCKQISEYQLVINLHLV